MGFAIAEVAAQFGAEVTLVAGPVELKTSHKNIRRIDVVSAQDMYEAMLDEFPKADIVIKSAAVADYRPKVTYDQKMKKSNNDLHIEFERTKDILKTLGEKKTSQFLVGFAAETNNPLEYGKKKLTEKNLDAIVINNVLEKGAGFGVDTNIVTYLNKEKRQENLPLASKREIAEQILQLIVDDMKDDEN